MVPHCLGKKHDANEFTMLQLHVGHHQELIRHYKLLSSLTEDHIKKIDVVIIRFKSVCNSGLIGRRGNGHIDDTYCITWLTPDV